MGNVRCYPFFLLGFCVLDLFTQKFHFVFGDDVFFVVFVLLVIVIIVVVIFVIVLGCRPLSVVFVGHAKEIDVVSLAEYQKRDWLLVF